MYKLTTTETIIRLSDNASIPMVMGNADYERYLQWVALGNVAQPADVPTPEQVARTLEVAEAGPVAKTWFAGQQAAIDFVRLTPAQQATAIDAMTLAQLRTVVKFLAVAVSMLIKRELL